MIDFDIFRRDLANWLRCCAESRRSFAAGHIGEDDLRVEMLYRLARDAENLDRQVFVLFELMVTNRDMALRFLQRREDLLSQVGVACRPKNATELLRWMIRRTLADDLRRSPRSDRARSVTLPRLNPDRARATDVDVSAGPAPIATAAAVGLCSWIGIVAPVLSVWELGRALGQWHDRVASDAQTPVPATVISSEPIGSVRHISLASNTVLQFQPSLTSVLCQAPVRVTSAAPPQTGTTIMVVPRSPYCDAPILASDIGDPTATFALAATLLIGGLVALKVRNWLRARHRRASSSYKPPWWHSADTVRQS